MRWTKPVVGVVCLMCLLVGDAFVSEASAQWMVDGVAWYGRPSGKRAGDCVGNCGAGCSSRVNPCGGTRQYWELVILDQNLVAEGQYEECVPEGDSLPRIYLTTWWQYDGLAEWRYHGYVTTGCWDHDYMCGGWWDPSCLAWGGCGTRLGPRVWSYQEWIWGVRYSREAIDWGRYGQC